VLAPGSIQSAPNAPLVPNPAPMEASTDSVLEPNLEMSSPCPHSIPVHSQIWSPLLGQAPRGGEPPKAAGGRSHAILNCDCPSQPWLHSFATNAPSFSDNVAVYVERTLESRARCPLRRCREVAFSPNNSRPVRNFSRRALLSRLL